MRIIDYTKIKSEVDTLGFSTIRGIYDENEIKKISDCIESVDKNKATFRKSKDLFAIRQFLKEVPETKEMIFNSKLNSIIKNVFGSDYFVVKSIYFDKPENSNWFVSYHQDLTISVGQKIEIENFGPWTTKQNQYAVQPPTDILENIYTIRIHLDETDENNGALKVIPNSHSKGILRPENIDWNTTTETICNVKQGGIMIMKPLILHGSNRTTNHKKRRVIHIEFSSLELPQGLDWSERFDQKALV
ncbi:phytanoyl-CoA dioxygenase family protein [Riemerella anatipestifer]|uniref:phytanoyl-CoA dioxygenase family protein n=1 Tax=Riemerella anatipestifer TaxID=34085 RepID=UPI0012AE3814|nr:phytanoyl-CoA dioxygenase family protein [Riemerella anatipestifer]MDY3520681.1 phytanoyl-CoA dioxygenase family protein [Riemerella anatipestifer]MDY3534202.1 phytanoyl-CoA dioxygenase family protein [Riemerella anatipestifer]MDY3535179.1 phytanoyl-CoA dioxygenase family protein [Riemerella anatipestifer]USL95427.1 phytanoyl-CoA dioxygenase family protein [Riemerella anatipestifer]